MFKPPEKKIMFSGITETLGYIEKITQHQGCKDFVIVPELRFSDIQIGDSVAVNGVCLTVTQYDRNQLSVTAVPETLRLTNLDNLAEKQCVNLERAMRVEQRLSGHFVQGHVDGMGTITDIQDEQGALRVTIYAPASITTYLVPKGFIAIDGMSITLIDTTNDYFTVTFIPHTMETTLVKNYTLGTKVNLEVDMFAKMIKKMIQQQFISQNEIYSTSGR